MSTCQYQASDAQAFGDELRWTVCGEPITGSGPCATCGGAQVHLRHKETYSYPTSTTHAYVPSVFTCAAGHVSAGVPA
jgi:hypothetical protein